MTRLYSIIGTYTGDKKSNDELVEIGVINPKLKVLKVEVVTTGIWRAFRLRFLLFRMRSLCTTEHHSTSLDIEHDNIMTQ